MELTLIQEKMKSYTYIEIARETGLDRLTVRAIAETTNFNYKNYLKVRDFITKKEREKCTGARNVEVLN